MTKGILEPTFKALFLFGGAVETDGQGGVWANSSVWKHPVWEHPVWEHPVWEQTKAIIPINPMSLLDPPHPPHPPPSATTNYGKIDAEERGDTTGVNTPFYLEQKKQNCRTNRKANRKASIMWALLLARIFEVTPLKCPHCSSPMKVISFITEPPTIRKILGHLGLPTEPPMIAPARSPPQVEMHFAQRHRNSVRTGDLAGDGNLFDQTHWPNCP